MSWGAIAGGIASAAIGSAGSLWSSNQNLKESKRNREWQERMSNTAHQREVADLRAAGLNPILSGLGGSGAAVGGGSMARTQNPFENAGNDFYSARRFSEIEKEQLKNETDLKESTTQLNHQNAALAVEQQKLAAINQKVSTAQEANIIADLPVKRALAAQYTASAAREFSQANLNSAYAAQVERHKYDFPNWLGTAMETYKNEGLFGLKPGTKVGLPIKVYDRSSDIDYIKKRLSR